MQIRWKSKHFSCLASLISTVLPSLIHNVKDTSSFYSPNVLFYQFLVCFQRGASIQETTMNILCSSMICMVVGSWLCFLLKMYCCLCMCLMSTYELTCHGLRVEIGEQFHWAVSLLLPWCGLWGPNSECQAGLGGTSVVLPGFFRQILLSDPPTHSLLFSLRVFWSETLKQVWRTAMKE